MRRADRLFRIIQQLRHERVTTARQLAENLEVSERTIYRDVQDLSLSGVPIIGETGTGYRLMPGFDLPPLMFSEDELAALLLGARMVQAWADPKLSHSARHALEKIESVIPARLKPELLRDDLLVPGFSASPAVTETLGELRPAIRNQQKLWMHYTREDGGESKRVIHPLGLVYWGRVWTLIGWCELRDDFRHFRVDRINDYRVMEETYEILPGRSLNDFLTLVSGERS